MTAAAVGMSVAMLMGITGSVGMRVIVSVRVIVGVRVILGMRVIVRMPVPIGMRVIMRMPVAMGMGLRVSRLVHMLQVLPTIRRTRVFAEHQRLDGHRNGLRG